MNAGSIDPILCLLNSTKLEVQEQAVWALGNISGDCDEYRQMILQRNGFSVIVAFANQNMDKVGVIKNCIWCLSNLCRNPKRDASTISLYPASFRVPTTVIELQHAGSCRRCMLGLLLSYRS